jgi:hypothetical protein
MLHLHLYRNALSHRVNSLSLLSGIRRISSYSSLHKYSTKPESSWKSQAPRYIRNYSTTKPVSDPPASPKSLWKQIREIAVLARPEVKGLAAGMGLLVISSAVTMSVPFSMGRIIDIVMTQLGVHSHVPTEATVCSRPL